MKFGSLFAGIGGLDLGLERAGMECAWQVEIDDYCTRVLEKHWPDVRRFGDVRGVGKHNLEAVDLIAGGFPCQPHSVAGKRKGAEDDRNLWPEFIRVIRETIPRYVLGENVPGIVTTYLDTVLSDLENAGYTCTTFNLPACGFDAPHRRERIFIVAYSKGNLRGASGDDRSIPSNGGNSLLADTERKRLEGFRGNTGNEAKLSGQSLQDRNKSHWTVEPDVGGRSHGFPLWLERHIGRGMSYEESARATQVLRELWDEDVAKALWEATRGYDRLQKSEVLFSIVRQYQESPDETRLLLESQEALEEFVRGLWQQGQITGSSHRSENRKQSIREHSDLVQTLSRLPSFNGEANWQVSSWEDGIPRVAKGVVYRMDRLRGLGNAVVPQVAQYIGERILEHELREKEIDNER